MAILKRTLLASLVIVAGAAAQAQEVTVRVGMVKSISSVATLTAIEKGYFKAFGIRVETEELDTSANVIALLAQNQLQLVEGGISAGYFNALENSDHHGVDRCRFARPSSDAAPRPQGGGHAAPPKARSSPARRAQSRPTRSARCGDRGLTIADGT